MYDYCYDNYTPSNNGPASDAQRSYIELMRSRSYDPLPEFRGTTRREANAYIRTYDAASRGTNDYDYDY